MLADGFLEGVRHQGNAQRCLSAIGLRCCATRFECRRGHRWTKKRSASPQLHARFLVSFCARQWMSRETVVRECAANNTNVPCANVGSSVPLSITQKTAKRTHRRTKFSTQNSPFPTVASALRAPATSGGEKKTKTKTKTHTRDVCDCRAMQRR